MIDKEFNLVEISDLIQNSKLDEIENIKSYLLDQFQEVEKSVLSRELDLSKEEDRKAIKKLATDINKSMKFFDDPIRSHLSKLKEAPKKWEALARENKKKL